MGGHHAISSLLEAKNSKILQMLYQRYCFCLHYCFGLHFYRASHARTDLHNEYVANFMFGSLFEYDYLLNVIIKEFMQKDSLN